MHVNPSASLLVLALLGAAPAAADLAGRVEAAMAADARSEADRARDRNRRPVQTLEFFGIEEDMKVLELLPGGGWYTRLLAPALKDTGALYVAIGTGRVAGGLLQEPGFDAVRVLEPDLRFERDPELGQSSVAPFSFGETGFDAALTFRNMHNFTAAGRAAVNAAVFEALRPGGIYGVVDHTRRHMEPHWSENRRRIDPVLVIREVTAAGFEFVDYSDLHHRPDDELRYEVGRRSVTGNTDRFTLLFRKPREDS